MEVGLPARHQRVHENNNMNNGHISNRGRTNNKPHHSKSKSAPVSGGEFHSPSRSHHTKPSNASREPNETEMSEKTQKIMDAFLKSIVDKHGVAEKIRRGSREKFTRRDGEKDIRIPWQTSRSYQSPSKPTIAPLRQESNDEKLYKVMHGKMPAPARQQSDVSLVSSDSVDSGPSQGRFQRTKSFTKAVRHSIVTELENQQERKAKSRRSSEDIPQTQLLYPDGGGSIGNEDKLAESPISHNRASSDPVIAKYDTTGRRKHQNKEKEKKGWFKIFKKKKDGHKVKDDSRDSATSGEAVATSATKVSKYHGERKATVLREDSTTSKRRSPSPPGSPKRTPKLIRRLSSRIRKSGKSESSSSSTNRSKSFDAVEEVDGFETTNGDAKSNSLPMEARYSTKPPQSTHKKHKDDRFHVSATAVDGVSDHGHRIDKKHRKDSPEISRPTTLAIPKKKSNWKKLKKIFVDSSSSSSSSSMSSRSSSEGDLTRDLHDRVGREEQVSKKSVQSDSEKSRQSVKYSNSDSQKISTDAIRGNYQHRQSKSMSDMDPQDKNIKDIAMKLRKVVDGYSHLFSQQYVGPAGQTQTPDSYRQDMLRSQGKTSPPNSVKRSTSHAPGIGRVPSHSLKAYYNLSGASRSSATSGEQRQARRLTREDISHRPSGSFDSPHRRPESTGSWSERVGTERHQRTVHVVHERHQRDSSDAGHSRLESSSQKRTPAVPPKQSTYEPKHSKSTKSHGHAPPPPPVASTSPNLRASRTRSRHPGPSLVDTDSIPAPTSQPNRHRFHIERHVDRTVTATSPSQTSRFHSHFDYANDVETDAVPSLPSFDDSTDVDMAMAFQDHEDLVITDQRVEQTIVTEEVDGIASGDALPRLRAATSPNLPMGDFDNGELDNDDEENPPGAVGGAAANEGIDMDELVDKLVEALCKKGDEITSELETPQIEDALTRTISELSLETAEVLMRRTLERIKQSALMFRHPDIIQLALIFDMAQLFRRLSMSSTVSGLLTSFINPIVKRFGGWTDFLMSSIDETVNEMDNKDVPSTSGQHDKARRNSEKSDTSDGEVD